MSALLAAGALLAFAVGAAHSYLGERYILIRLFRRPVPKLFGGEWFTRRTLRFAWHLTTVAWWGFAAQLALAARATPPAEAAPYLQAVAVTFAVSAAIALATSRGRHLAWIVFLTIAGCAWWGAG